MAHTRASTSLWKEAVHLFSRSPAIENPAVETAAVYRAVLGDAALLVGPETTLTKEQEESVWAACMERSRGVPLAYITGVKEFWSREFEVTKDTLVPRPETELLVETAIAEAGRVSSEQQRILELGVGSCCVLASILLELPGASGVGVDLSEKAVAVAQRNCDKYGLTHRVELLKSKWACQIQDKPHFDVVVSNPPYLTREELKDPSIRHESRLALHGRGADGTRSYENLASNIGRRLDWDSRPSSLCLEIGAAQEERVVELVTRAIPQLDHAVTVRDIAQRPRVLVFRTQC